MPSPQQSAKPMPPESQIVQMILQELQNMRNEQREFQAEVREEFKRLRADLNQKDKDIASLKGKLALLIAAASAIAAALVQWVSRSFFA